MIGRAVSVFGKGALRSRSSNLAIRGENAPGMVSSRWFNKNVQCKSSQDKYLLIFCKDAPQSIKD